MKTSAHNLRVLLLFVLAILIACSTGEAIASSEEDALDRPLPDHPRIMLLEGEEDVIKQSIEANPVWQKMHEAIVAESDNTIELPEHERTMVGRRLLGTSREVLRRVFYLSYSYRMTGEDKYFERAEKEMLAAASFSDWNPSHFLDVGEMTMALAIGYDWLFDRLSSESKQIIREAILEKGLEPSFDSDYNWFLGARHNWNQVCNAGMTFGALAIYDDHPDIARKVIERAIETIPLAKEDYRPDGAYPEGYGYWGYGTSFNVMFLSAIDKVWPGGFDYSEHSAFLETGSFRKHMIGPTLENFNWGDNSPSASLTPAMFWFADKNNAPTLLWKESLFLQTDDHAQFTSNRLLPAILIWGKDISFDEIVEPEDKFYVAQGAMPLTLKRTSWSDPEGIFLGFKGGSPSVNHGHMDIGSFVVEADGVRWASDLGAQNYHSLESRGMNIWGMSQDSERWTVYRLNNYSHSTLTINGELQRVDGYSKIEEYSDDPGFSFGITDMTSVYEKDMASVIRGAGIVDQEYVVVRDELEATAEPATVRWQMLTEADVTITGNNAATLTRDGQRLMLQVDEPANTEVTTWSTQPDTEYDAPNPGTILVGFETEVPANASETLQVKLIPGSSNTEAVFNKRLSEWSAESGADARKRQDLETVRNRVIGELLEPPVDEDEIKQLMDSIRDDGTWPGINYEDTSRTAFEHSIHLANMVDLGRAYKKPESSYYQDPDLKSVIWKALDFWIEHDFICENWWWNQIGTPERIGNLLLIMDEDLTDEQIRKAGPIVGRANLDAWGARPGGDLIKIAGILGKYALFERDLDVLDEAVTAIAGEIGFAVDRGDPSDVRGLQTDFSFHHRHDRVTSTITYGQGFASYFVDWAEKVNGTVFDFPEEATALIVDFYLDGIGSYLAFGKYPDPGGRNRGITRLGALDPRGPELPEALRRITDYRQEELEAIAQIRRGEREPDLSRSRFFWNTEYYSHQRPQYFTSVRMYSSRNHSVEVPYNSEGLKNHHLADGYTFITRTGEEYMHIFPVWDWQKIPGTTVVQKPSLPSPDDVQQPGLTDFVGGVTDGIYGAAAFDFESPLDPLSARKSWFFFDEEFVALGTDIHAESEHPVATTLNQSLLTGDVKAAFSDSESILQKGHHDLEGVRWIHHDQTAYLFPGSSGVRLENNQRTGAWGDINEQTWALTRDEVTKDVFTLWIDHGVRPQRSEYTYIVVPGIEADDVARYESTNSIKILANTPQVQAVQHTGLGISQIVFYEPADVEIADGLTITADAAGMVMVKHSGEHIEQLTVSDPTRELRSYRLDVTTHLEAEDSRWGGAWNEDEGTTSVHIQLPDGDYAGQSVTVKQSR